MSGAKAKHESLFHMVLPVTNVGRNEWFCEQERYNYSFLQDFTKHFDLPKTWAPLHLPGGSIQILVDGTHLYIPPKSYTIYPGGTSVPMFASGSFGTWNTTFLKHFKRDMDEITLDLVRDISDTLLYIHYMNWRTYFGVYLGTNLTTNVNILTTKRFNRFFDDTQMNAFDLQYLKDHPYAILPYIDDFMDADRIEVSLGTVAHVRIKCLVEWVCRCITIQNQDASNASSFVPKSKLEFTVRYKLKALQDEELTEAYGDLKRDDDFLSGLLQRFRISDSTSTSTSTSQTDQEELVSLFYTWNIERSIYQTLWNVSHPDVSSKETNLWSENSDETMIGLTPKQREIVKSVFHHRVVVCNGYPGTGKTTLVRSVVEIATKNLKLKVCLVSPTGKAAKVLSKATNHPAYTIHKFLYHNDKLHKMDDNEKKKLLPTMSVPVSEDVDIFILDECSMVSMQLLYNFLKYTQPHQKIVMIGDVDQLPPIEYGSPFRDIVLHGKPNKNLAKFMLTQIHRQDAHSNIIPFALDVIQGRPVNTSLLVDKDGDIEFLNASQQTDVLNTIKHVVRQCKKQNDNFQIIIPTKKSALGTERLNEVLCPLINPSYKQGFGMYQCGDRIIFTKNEGDVCNGDIATIIRVHSASRWTVAMDHDGSEIDINPTNYSFEHAYCITVHKSQGSEYDVTILVLHDLCSQMLLQRKLLYTAVTRAKKKLILIGTVPLIRTCVKNNTSENTKSILKLFLTEELKG